MDGNQKCRLLSLPAELRRLVYTYCLVAIDGRVILVSNYFDGQPPTDLRFYATEDLSLLETNRQIRAEGSEIFYAENLFVLNSYVRKRQEFGEPPLYGMLRFRVDLRNVRKAHVLTPQGFWPESYDDCIRGAGRMQAFLENLEETLHGEHSMEYLLIESYELEAATIGDDLSFARDVSDILRPLESVRGLTMCHIRSLQGGIQPYLRYLEQIVTCQRSLKQPCVNLGKRVAGSALKCRADSTCAGRAYGRDDGDSLLPHQIFRILGLEPLYSDTAFLDHCTASA